MRQLLAAPSGSTTALVVTGGAGTGKSALALTLLGEALRAGYRARHATGPQAFTTALRKTAGHGSRQTQQLFQYFGTACTEPGDLDLLVCDGAHQLRATSNTRYTPASRRSDRTRAAELLNAARVVVFCLDEEQAVRPGQVGTRTYIETAAHACGATVRTLHLGIQHRSRSPRYDTWVRHLLGLDDGPLPPASWNGEKEGFELRVADSPGELEQILRARAERGASARMTAGYCWPWSEATPGNPLVDDIVIGDWRHPWSVKDIPGAEMSSRNVLGVMRPGGRLVVESAGLEAAVQDAHRVLLTRARAGTILYSTDSETRALLHELADR